MFVSFTAAPPVPSTRDGAQHEACTRFVFIYVSNSAVVHVIIALEAYRKCRYVRFRVSPMWPRNLLWTERFSNFDAGQFADVYGVN